MATTGRFLAARLFILGELHRAGPVHGHHIRRAAQLGQADVWAGVHAGSIYGALHRLEAEGLIEAVRTEQEGRYPERTVYAITEEGRRALEARRDAVLRTAQLRPDPFDLALQLTEDMPPAALRAAIEARIEALLTAARSAERQRAEAEQSLGARELAVFRHFALRVEAEVRWHRELLAGLT